MAKDVFWRWIFDPPIHVGRRAFRELLLLAIVGVAVVITQHYFALPDFKFAAEGAALNGIILAFLVGFRNKASYDRWWEGRIQWGKLVNDSRNFCLKYREHAAPNHEERERMAERVSGFAVALMRHLRTGMDTFDPSDPTARHEAIDAAGRLHAEIALLISERRIDSNQARMLDMHASGFMDVSGACERIRGTPIADSYRALLRHGMILALLFTMVLTTWNLGAIGILYVLFPAYFLIAMELVAEDIENPFGATGDALDLEAYCATIRRSATQILINPHR